MIRRHSADVIRKDAGQDAGNVTPEDDPLFSVFRWSTIGESFLRACADLLPRACPREVIYPHGLIYLRAQGARPRDLDVAGVRARGDIIS